MIFNYPFYTPSDGNLTSFFRDQYIHDSINNNSMSTTAFRISQITSLTASNNPSNKIYFWQLYSIIGPKPIQNLIRIFYTKVFNDTENPWFSNEFKDLGSIDYHVKGQSDFWIDIMGGGPTYTKPYKYLYHKHKLVSNIMTNKGANRWMKHMIDSLYEINLCQINDKRVIPCITDFLYYFMNKYAMEFDFNLYNINFHNISKL